MMRSILTAVVSAIEAFAVGLAAFVVIVLGALLVWWQAFDLAADPGVVFASAASLWSLAFFVPLGFEIPVETMASLGLPHEALQLTVSLAPLGITFGAVALAVRAGWRWATRGVEAGIGGIIGSGLGFAAFATVMAQFAANSHWPMIGSILMPVAVYIGGVMVGSFAYVCVNRPATWQSLVRRSEKQLAEFGVPQAASFGARLNETLYIAALLFAGFAGLAALGVGLSLFGQFAEAIAITQGLQLDAWGAICIWIAELMYLPVAWIWGGAWLTGASIDLGSGGGFSAFASPEAVLPAFPLFAALPEGWGTLGLLVPLIVVIFGVVVGHAVMRRFAERTPLSLLGPALSAALLVGLTWALLSAMGSGSIGPGSLTEVGPNAWVVGGLLALELGVGSVIGLLTAQASAGLLGKTHEPEFAGNLASDPLEAGGADSKLRAARAARSHTPWWTLGDRAGQPETGPVTTASPVNDVLPDDDEIADHETAAITAAVKPVGTAVTAGGAASEAGTRTPEHPETGELPAPISLSEYAEKQAAELAEVDAALAEVEYFDSGATAPGDSLYETETLETTDFGSSFFSPEIASDAGVSETVAGVSPDDDMPAPRETPLYDREAEAAAEAQAALERQRAVTGPAQQEAEEAAALAAYAWDTEPETPANEEHPPRGWRRGPKKR